MKNILVLLLLFIFFTGCNEDSKESLAPVGGVISLSSRWGLENEPEAKSRVRANTNMKYVLEAWSRGVNSQCVLHEEFPGLSDGVAMEIMLIPGDYDFLFWADYDQGYYKTENLRAVEISTVAYTSGERDAFAGVQRNVTWTTGTNLDVTLLRPLAKLVMQNKTPFTEENAVVVTYHDVPTQYDVSTGTSSVPQEITITYSNTESGKNIIGEDFLFIPSNGQLSKLETKVGDVRKSIDNLPLKKNYKTIVTARFDKR